MAKMVRLLAFFMLFSTLVFAQAPLINMKQNMPKQMNNVVLLAMLSKAPSELDPEMAIITGSIFQNGMPELKVNKNLKKAKLYYESAATRGKMIANLILANIALEDKNIKQYIEKMEIIIKADDKLSIPSGIQLSAFWTEQNKIDKAMYVLRYLADRYDEPKSQFLVGWGIISGEYTPSDLTKNDGKFYLYQACANPKATDDIKIQCKLYSKK